ESEGVAAAEERLELAPRPLVEQDRVRPAASAAEHVAIGEAAARGEALEARERAASGDEVGHMQVDRLEAGAVEGGRHLDLAVHPLLSQDGDARPLAGRNGNLFFLESEMQRKTRVI